MVTAIKEAQDGDGIVIRAFETLGMETKTQMHFLGVTIPLSFGKYEIKTIRMLRDGTICESDLLEEISLC